MLKWIELHYSRQASTIYIIYNHLLPQYIVYMYIIQRNNKRKYNIFIRSARAGQRPRQEQRPRLDTISGGESSSAGQSARAEAAKANQRRGLSAVCCLHIRKNVKRGTIRKNGRPSRRAPSARAVSVFPASLSLRNVFDYFIVSHTRTHARETDKTAAEPTDRHGGEAAKGSRSPSAINQSGEV